MAEGLFRKYAPEDYEAISAGTEPSDSYQFSRNTREVMIETGMLKETVLVCRQKTKL